MTSRVPVVAVDGPSGSGKGTLAARLAIHLHWHLLDSGALYRIVGWAALDRQEDFQSPEGIAALAQALAIDFSSGRVRVDGRDVTDAIRLDDVSAAASRVAAMGPVRQALLHVQHGMRQPPGLVADGRDMGTVVFPDAVLKIFLDASAEVRAERRYKQLKDKGLDVSLRALLATIEERDARDRSRAVSPLVKAPDAIVIDSTRLSADRVLELVITECRRVGLETETRSSDRDTE